MIELCHRSHFMYSGHCFNEFEVYVTVATRKIIHFWSYYQKRSMQSPLNNNLLDKLDSGEFKIGIKRPYHVCISLTTRIVYMSQRFHFGWLTIIARSTHRTYLTDSCIFCSNWEEIISMWKKKQQINILFRMNELIWMPDAIFTARMVKREMYDTMQSIDITELRWLLTLHTFKYPNTWQRKYNDFWIQYILHICEHKYMKYELYVIEMYVTTDN